MKTLFRRFILVCGAVGITLSAWETVPLVWNTLGWVDGVLTFVALAIAVLSLVTDILGYEMVVRRRR